MAIEFNCPHCDKSLSTSEDRAGRKAKCPGCGEVVTVPGLDQPAAEDDFEEDLPPPPPVGKIRDTRAKVACPMCGGEVLAAAKRCKHCGEDLSPAGGDEAASGATGELTKIEAGEVIGSAWKVYLKNLAPCLVGTFLVNLLSQLATIPQQIVPGIVMGDGEDPTGVMVGLAMLLGFMAMSFCVGAFLQIGLCQLFLKAARGEDPQVGDIFSGGKFFLRYAISLVLFSIAFGIGMVLCIIPGILVSCLFYPFAYVIVAENSKGIDCLSRSQEITKGNLLQIFVLMLAGAGINLLGILALCVGAIFTVPLTLLFTAVAYLKMTGQEVVEV